MKRHETLIGRAIKVAQQSTYRWKHGAVVAKNSKIIGFAPNKFRNAPSVDSDNVTVHAEAAVIRELLKNYPDLKGTTIYIARVAKAGNATISRPCPNCMKSILDAGIREIVYTNELGGYSVEKLHTSEQSAMIDLSPRAGS
jgi:tRNA(Arg) A34 adenosine deaminase TadA